MPRPSLERTIKYIPIVPQANRKLSREARRGSHDLRKLVGHANFLDTLMFELHGETAEEEGEVAPSGSEELQERRDANVLHWEDLQNDEDWETADSSSGSEDEDEDEDEDDEDENDEAITPEFDDENDEAITPEFDDENDEGHALNRMVSRGAVATAVPKAAPLMTNPVVTPELRHLANVAISGVAEHQGLDDDMSLVGKDVPEHLDLGGEPQDYFGIQTEAEIVAVADGLA